MPMASIYITHYLFNRLDKLSHGTNPLLIPPRVQYKIAGTTSSVKGVLADFSTPILPNIGGEPTR